MIVDLIKLREYETKGLLTECIHPERKDLSIFNYTKECQFSQAWDEVTLMCRGLIVNTVTGEVIARPYPKFFNYEELIAKQQVVVGKEGERPIIMEKYDGSLGILYFIDGVPHISTRGSFKSEQALWATAWWRANIPSDWKQDVGVTHLFEIIYPENRIVVDYEGWNGLVYLGTVDVETGVTGIDLLAFKDTKVGMPSFEMESFVYEEMKGRNEKNKEGFVVYFPESDLRYKIKFEDYVKLHRIMTGLNEISIWEELRDKGNTIAMRKDVPEEMLPWLDGVVGEMVRAYRSIEWQVKEDVSLCEGIESRKDCAAILTKSKYPGISFSMLDKKDDDVREAIVRMIRPKGNKVYKVDIDN